MPIVCPQCGKDDMIQKVSAIYSAGIANGSYSGLNTGVASGTSQTALSSKLSPPVRPSAPSQIGWIIVGGVVLIGLVTLPFPGIFVIAGALVLVVLSGKGEKAKQLAYQQAMQKWNDAVARWDRLYYCARNDCIFDPNTGASDPADRIYNLLY